MSVEQNHIIHSNAVEDDMGINKIIEVLENHSCYECAWGCFSHKECECKCCDYKEAMKEAINKLEKT